MNFLEASVSMKSRMGLTTTPLYPICSNNLSTLEDQAENARYRLLVCSATHHIGIAMKCIDLLCKTLFHHIHLHIFIYNAFINSVCICRFQNLRGYMSCIFHVSFPLHLSSSLYPSRCELNVCIYMI